MKLGILISSFALLKPHNTSFFIAREALARGHEVFICQYADLHVDIHGDIKCQVATVDDPKESNKAYFNALLKSYLQIETRALKKFDCLWIRIDWHGLISMGDYLAPRMIVQFAQLLEAQGVQVIPNVSALGTGNTKLYLDQFPEELRPPTITTRNHKDIKSFASEVGGTIVLKPAIGGQGRNVFLYKLSEPENANQIFDVFAGKGFISVQKYIQDTPYRSTRIFLFNGAPLFCKGKYATLMLQSANGDFRSNSANGGTPVPATLTDEMLNAAQIIAPKLKEDGFFLSAIDMVAGKVVEVNQMNVDGMRAAQRLQSVNFTEYIVQTLENELPGQ